MSNKIFDSKVVYGRYKDIKTIAENKGKTVYRFVPANDIDDYEEVLFFNN